MRKTDFQNEVVYRIRQLRTELGISQMALAKIIFVSNGQIGNIESPKFQHKYTLKQLDMIAAYFEVSIGYLLTGNVKILSSEEIIKLLIKYEE